MLRSNRRNSVAGFTLVELIVSLFVMVELILAVLMLFDFNNKLARVQTNVADMQQSLRIAQYDLVRLSRMVGRGGLPFEVLRPTGDPAIIVANDFSGPAVRVQNNVAASTRIAGGATPLIREGSDVLTMRGVFSTPIFQLNYLNAGTFITGFGGDPNTGRIIIESLSPTGVPQDLQAWTDAIAAHRDEAIILISPLDDTIYAVVKLDWNQSSVTGSTAEIVYQFQGDTTSDAYKKLNLDGKTYPAATLQAVAYAGILEEYRFYIRDDSLDPTDPVGSLSPKLTRARFYPGTNGAWNGEAANISADIADNIYDLQVSLAIDTNNDGAVPEPNPPTAADEWLFNATADDATEDRWEGGPRTATPPPSPNLFYLRVNALAMTDRRDPKYRAPLITTIEDHAYATSILNTRAEKRMMRRRLQQTVVDVRNLG